MKLITHLSWLLRALLFLAVFAFALMNTDPVTLRFFLGQTWEIPMILALLLFFAFGAAIGVLACLSRLLGQRRKIQKLERELRAAGNHTLPPHT
ncbi:MAG: LapA family protein [Betaproteobacteria bacterium]|nr:MAG: LapA family protein [Betaproteobacteria bacterium]